MPPKKQQAPNKKTVEKKKEKIVEDKTFGLKNKKGKKQQQFIKNVTNQVKFGGQSQQKRESDEYQLRKERAEKEKEKAALEALFKPVQTQKISAGADPKSVLCLFFQQGQCTKGDKCKFSHDLSLEGKAEKRSMYVDKRDEELENDTMDQWDEDKLKEVVEKKHAAVTKPKTDIVCRHFLHAIEKGIYGWFWECPSGDKCIYRHALPPGFVFKKQMKEQEEMQPQNTITLEELVEEEREQLAQSGKKLTKVTLETFLAWKKRKLKEKSDKAQEEMSQRKEAFKAGRTHGISGREMFMFNPQLMEGDDQEGDEGEVVVKREEDEEEQDVAVDVTDVSAVVEMTTPLPGDSSGEVRHGTSTQQTVGEASGGQSDTAVSSSTSGHALQGACAASTAAVGDTDPPLPDTANIPVDETLFLEEDPSISDNNYCAVTGGVERLKLGEHEEDIAVDESLFDVENLEDLDLSDPSLLQRPLGEN